MNLKKIKDFSKSKGCVGYAVNYRDMHTAIHGLWVYDSKKDAEDVYDMLCTLDSVESMDEYELILYSATENINTSLSKDKINYRYIDNGKYYIDDESYVEVINDIAVDLY